MYILLTLICLLLVAVLVLLMRNLRHNNSDQLLKQLAPQMGESISHHLQGANQQLVLMAEQALKGKQETIATDMANKERSMNEMVKRVLESVEAQKQALHQTDRLWLSNFDVLKTELEQGRRVSDQLRATTEGLKRILSDNRSRGIFGEQVADDLLRIAGFVQGVNYTKQETQNDSRPDFTVLLPGGLKINIDVKFPYNNLQAYVEAEDPEVKKKYAQAFKADVREKISQVHKRGYITAGETVDFAILFIPNEMIFSYIYDNMNDLWQEATEKKVVLAGPFSFTAILRLITQAHKAFAMEESTQQIVTAIRQFEKEWIKYNEDFERLGTAIARLDKTYNEVNGTRSKQLTRAMSKVITIDDAEDHNPQLLDI